MIRIAEPDLGADVEALVLEVLRSGRLAQGPMVERFEAACAAMAGTRHAVAVANGTVSLEAALAVLGIGPGDEVITSPFTFAATLNAVVSCGATVRFADIGHDHAIDGASIEPLIGPRTSVLLPVHLYGLPADMGSITDVADRHGLAIVEDAAQAHGATIDGRPVGSFGLGSFSFYATKNVTAGEGGVITTSSDEHAAALRILRNQGMTQRYHYEVVGRNWRLTELQAAVALPQMARLEATNARRAANAAGLSARLADLDLVLPAVPAGRVHVWHQYTVLLPEGVDRSAVVDALGAEGVETGIYYPSLVWDHPPYRDNPLVVRDDTPVAAGVARRCLSLPVHQRLAEADLDAIAAAVAKAL